MTGGASVLDQSDNPSNRISCRGAPTNRAFQAMLDTVPGAWFFARRDGSFAYVNVGACCSLGYTKQELLARTIFEIDPDVGPEQWEQLWCGTRPPDAMAIRARHRRRDGTIFPVEVRASRVFVEGEDLAASYTIDLTTSEETRAALEITEQRLQRLLANIPDLVFTLSYTPEPHFLFVGGSVRTLLGYEPQALLDHPAVLRSIVEPEDWEHFLNLPASSSDVGVILRFRHSSGQSVWLEFRATPLTGADGELRFEGVARDVSRTYAVERVNRRLVAALDQAMEAVVVTDAWGRVEFVNPAYQRMSGIPASEALGKRWVELEVKGIHELENAVRRALAGKPWHGRYNRKLEAGKQYSEEATISPIRDSTNRVVGCVVVKRDITNQIELEKQLRQAQKMEAVGQLAGSIAHDFNNLLQVIQGNAAMLARSKKDADPEPYLNEVLVATDRAVRLVRQLLSFSRKDSTEQARLDLVPTVGAMIDMLRRLLGSHIQVHWEPHVSRALILGNTAQLEQVIMNLCINARDAMASGGTLTLELERLERGATPHAALAQSKLGIYRLSVSDTGCGIAPEYRDRIFEPFFTLKEPGKGTGLGLATVYSIVEAHAGAIDFDSTPGKGTTFNVYLPMTEGCACDQEAASPRVAASGAGRLVLVAEDEEGIRKLTARYLEEAGFRVVTAVNGQDAIERISTDGHRLALAVLDAMMPHGNGLEVYEALRKNGLRTPVLFVTGHDFATLSHLEEQPSVAKLHKPFDPEVLVSKAHELLLLSENDGRPSVEP